MLFSKIVLLRDHQGNSLKEQSPDENGDVVTSEVTLGYALENVLVNGGAQDTGDQKFKQFLLAKRIFESEDGFDLSAEEITRIRELAAPMFSPVGLGAIYTALDNPTTLAEIATAKLVAASAPPPAAPVRAVPLPVPSQPGDIKDLLEPPIGAGDLSPVPDVPAAPEDTQ